MPHLSDELRAQRRRHVLTSAWACFSRDGFHATSMDQVIAATGMSSSAAYRYFRSKDELIEATVDEALGQSEALFAELLAGDPVPTPRETFTALVKFVHGRRENPDYDLSKLAMQAWVEALRRPHLHDRVAAFYRAMGARLRELAERWRESGHIASDADTEAIAALLTVVMPGMIVNSQVVGPLSPDQLLTGILDLAGDERS